MPGRQAGGRPPFPTESGSDAAANPETRREMKRIHFLPERNLAGGKVWGLSGSGWIRTLARTPCCLWPRQDALVCGLILNLSTAFGDVVARRRFDSLHVELKSEVDGWLNGLQKLSREH